DQHPLDDEISNRMKRAADHWRPISSLSDGEAADVIRRDRIDILVDLKMHSGDHRLLIFAQKPAPVQVTWLGYPGSSGVETIDYRLTDRFLDPPGAASTHSIEKVIRLPDCFWCYDPLESGDVPTNPLPADGNGFITFGCLNNLFKINDWIVDLWARLMERVEHSQLLLLMPECRRRHEVLVRLQQAGINADRVRFAARRHRTTYLRQYHQIDIALDSFPYNGHTTSLDSIWMGVPVVSIAGGIPVSRGGLSILSNVGLGELAAATPEEFVRVGEELANDVPRLRKLRETLRERMRQTPLMDARLFARNLEEKYREMWRDWCTGGEHASLK
ncbi:MAG: hypothetical protein JO353_09510, partial [Phycisphaerae bacterium]|nr:hypothetical protein [Phycisphaerae bacterium]